jgi:exoribonuclease R
MTDRVQSLIDSKRYIRGQFVVREGSGEYVVQVTDQQTLLYVNERYPEHVNRAIQGSLVITERVNIQEMRYSKKEFVRVLRVDYPARMGHMYGKLEQDTYGDAIFVPMDTRFPKMQVLEVSKSLEEEIVHPPTHPFSLLMGSTLEPSVFENSFVKIKFIEWSPHKSHPFCKLYEILGSTTDRESFANVLMYQNGITFDKFSSHAEREATRLKNDFQAFLKKELTHRRNLLSLPVVTIDGKNSRAIDDAISLESLPDEKYRIGIHISDVASLIKRDSEIDKEAFSRVESTYVLSSIKKCHKPMLPSILNADLGSLV